MKIKNILLSVTMIVALAITFTSCSNDDGTITEQQGTVELNADNLTSKFVNYYNYTSNLTTKSFENANGTVTNNLLTTGDYQMIQFSKNNNNFCVIDLPYLNAKQKVETKAVHGTWEILSPTSIRIYGMTDYKDLVLENVKLERKGSVENEVMTISYTYQNPVLNDKVKVEANTKKVN